VVELQQGLTEEEFAFLGHSELLAEESRGPEPNEETNHPLPADFRERLILGDLSW
jgi:hypothetical protein